jgi:hypothetical protein
MFTKEGIFPVVIVEVEPMAEPKFAQGEDDFDVAIKVRHREDASQEDWWSGEVSDNYPKYDNATETCAAMTFRTLRKLGWESEAKEVSDLTAEEIEAIGNLVGVETTAKVVESQDGKFFNVRGLAIGGSVKALDTDKKARLLAKFGGGKSGAPKSAPKPRSKPAPATKVINLSAPQPEQPHVDTLPSDDDIPF